MSPFLHRSMAEVEKLVVNILQKLIFAYKKWAIQVIKDKKIMASSSESRSTHMMFRGMVKMLKGMANTPSWFPLQNPRESFKFLQVKNHGLKS